MFSRNTTDKVIDRIEMFNAVPVSEEEIEKAYKDLFDTREDRQVSEDPKTLVCEELLPPYVRASKIAEANQKYHRLAGRFIYILAPFAVAAVAAPVAWDCLNHPAFFLIETVCLILILVCWLVARGHKFHHNWIEHRLLAELIRSATFLAVCGLKPSYIQRPSFMGSANQPDDWVVVNFNKIRDRLPQMPECQRRSCKELVEYIQRFWIRPQIDHHTTASKQAHCLNRCFEYGSISCFSLALVVALLDLLSNLAPKWESMLIYFAITLPALGAAMEGFRSHREYPRLDRRCKNMASALRDLDTKLSPVSNPEDLENLLRKAEESMVQETLDWHMLMRFTVVKPVA